jgi:hypothetical protein
MEKSPAPTAIIMNRKIRLIILRLLGNSKMEFILFSGKDKAVRSGAKMIQVDR